MPTYANTPRGIRAEQLIGFFVGWPAPPTPERHLELLRGSDAAVIAIDELHVVGYVTAVSDGVLSAFIPFLEVLPTHQHQGIATELLKRLLKQLDQPLHGRSLAAMRSLNRSTPASVSAPWIAPWACVVARTFRAALGGHSRTLARAAVLAREPTRLRGLR